MRDLASEQIVRYTILTASYRHCCTAYLCNLPIRVTVTLYPFHSPHILFLLPRRLQKQQKQEQQE